MARKKAAKKAVDLTAEVLAASHPFADGTGRFAVDRLLRENGFKIFSRPRKGESWWVKGGVIYIYSQAVREVCFRKLQNAVDEQNWYNEGLLY